MKAAKCIATMRIADVFEESKEYRDRLGFIVRYYYGYREAAPLAVLDRMNKLLTEQEKMMDGKQGRLFA